MTDVRYSTDKLLEEHPEKLEGLKFIKGNGDSSIRINNVMVFADNYNMLYAENFVAISFYHRDNKIAVITAFGGNKHKKDERIIVGDGFIISETSFRIMDSVINQ